MKIAYILLRFPHFTETFVAKEIESVRSRHIDVRIISLLRPKPGPVQPLSADLAQYAWYAPSPARAALWKAQAHFLLKSPRTYLRLLGTLLRQPYPRRPVALFAKRILVFLKAVCVAHHLKESEVTLLHSHFAWLSGAAAWICARLLKVPFTITVHAYDIYFKNDLLGLVSREASRLVSISEYNRAQVAATGSISARSISVIHCGVEHSEFAERPARGLEAGLCGPVKILSVGSLFYMKGHRNLISACHLLSERGLDFACTIIGSGPEEPALRELIRACGLENRVKLPGALAHPEVLAAYYRNDLFVLACTVAPEGERDGIPVVLMEAGMAGLPLISTPVSGVPEIIHHGQTGWLAPTNDPAALADAIAVLAQDPALQRRLGENARALVEARFDLQKSVAQLAALWQETCARNAGNESMDKSNL